MIDCDLMIVEESIMRVIFSSIFIHVFLLYPLLAFATSDPSLPDALMYRGKPLDPLCLFQIEDTKGVVKLNQCGLSSDKKPMILGKNNQLISKGFFGYDYSLKLNDAKSISGYSYYKALGNVGHSAIVQTINNSGGTGTFSFLNLVKRYGNTLKISVLNGGDRCNGGLVDMRREGKGASEHLVYSVRLTAFDFLPLANDNPYKVNAYDDLASCAICCAGVAVFQRHIGTNFKHEKLLYVDVSDHVNDLDHSASQPKYQGCFDKLLKEYASKNNGKLDAKQLSRFTHQFNTQCVHNKLAFEF